MCVIGAENEENKTTPDISKSEGMCVCALNNILDSC